MRMTLSCNPNFGYGCQLVVSEIRRIRWCWNLRRHLADLTVIDDALNTGSPEPVEICLARSWHTCPGPVTVLFLEIILWSGNKDPYLFSNKTTVLLDWVAVRRN